MCKCILVMNDKVSPVITVPGGTVLCDETQGAERRKTAWRWRKAVWRPKCNHVGVCKCSGEDCILLTLQLLLMLMSPFLTETEKLS